MPLKFASVCSGIEAASVAWLPLGMKCAFTAEIEPFPCAVLKHHYPETPNHGDITKFKEWLRQPIDILVGGTPCQSFSVAGLRKGLADPRGNLALTFLAIAERFAPTWVVWENVPGVLSVDFGRTFAAFVGGLGQLGYGFAYRILDAQYFGVPQRRRRVFVAGHIGGQWQRAAAILFERESLCGHPAPGRETRKGTAGGVAPGIGASGRGFSRAGETRGQDPVIPIQEIGKRQSGTPENGTGYGHPGDPMFTLQSTAVHGLAAPIHGDPREHKGGSNPTEGHFVVASTIRSCSSTRAGHQTRAGDRDENLIVHSLRADGFDASEDGTGRGTPLVPEISPALKRRDCKGPSSDGDDGDGAPLLPIALSLAIRGRDGSPHAELGDDKANAILTPNGGRGGIGVGAALQGMAVRLLTPRECERLQGFPDDYTMIQYRGKPAHDGPRYKALGNSMAVPVMRWIGKRIQMVEEFCPL